MIAQSANVSVGTVIAVGTKDDLLVACFLREIEEVSTEHTASLPATINSPSSVAKIVFVDYFQLISIRADLARAWGAALLTNTQYSDTLRYLHNSLTAELHAVLAGHAPQDLLDQVIEDLYITYLGYLFAWASGVYSEKEVTSAMANNIERTLQGIGIK